VKNEKKWPLDAPDYLIHPKVVNSCLGPQYIVADALIDHNIQVRRDNVAVFLVPSTGMLAQDESPYRASVSEDMSLWKAGRPYLEKDAADRHFPREKLRFLGL
jgi:hypothetical protein